jgi:S-adenosylmethionine/arginine decarboxylase-like enzyme
MSLVSAHINLKNDNVPYGATMVYLLSESHLSIHTFVDEGKITIDLFTCSLSVENEKTKSIIKDIFVVKTHSVLTHTILHVEIN